MTLFVTTWNILSNVALSKDCDISIAPARYRWDRGLQVMTLPLAVLRMNRVWDTEASSRALLRMVIGGRSREALGAASTLTDMVSGCLLYWSKQSIITGVDVVENDSAITEDEVQQYFSFRNQVFPSEDDGVSKSLRHGTSSL